MSKSPAYYSAKIRDLQEKQAMIYEGWLNSQHQIFERYMKEFESMLKNLQKSQRRRLPKRRKIRKAKSKRRRR